MKPALASIRSVRTEEYGKMLSKMSSRVVEMANDRYEKLFCVDPHHPLLAGFYYKSRIDNRPVYRVEISYGTRAMAYVEESGGVKTFVWFWVGTHETYNGYSGRNLYQ